MRMMIVHQPCNMCKTLSPIPHSTPKKYLFLVHLFPTFAKYLEYIHAASSAGHGRKRSTDGAPSLSINLSAAGLRLTLHSYSFVRVIIIFERNLPLQLQLQIYSNSYMVNGLASCKEIDLFIQCPGFESRLGQICVL